MNEVSQPPAPLKPKLPDSLRRAIQLGVALAPLPRAAQAHGRPLPLSPGLDSRTRGTAELPPQTPRQRGDRDVKKIGPNQIRPTGRSAITRIDKSV